MKNILSTIIGILILGSVFSQDAFLSSIRKFSIGVGLHTDIWQGNPPGMFPRAINQGVQVNGMYNYQIKESAVNIAGGVGIGTHNLYTNTYIPDIKADSISFIMIPDNISYKKSKLSLAYIDIPVEFRIKTRKHVQIAFGFKVGFNINAHVKYKGNSFTSGYNGSYYIDGAIVTEKKKNVRQIETIRYGPTFRIGYKWFNLTAYYQISKVFKVDRGPALYPISFGIAVIPY